MRPARPVADGPQAGFEIDSLKRRVNTSDIVRYLTTCEIDGCEIPLEQARTLWHGLMRFLSGQLVDGRAVVFEKMVVLAPYMKKRHRTYHPKLGKCINVPSRPFVRMILSPALKAAMRAGE